MPPFQKSHQPTHAGQPAGAFSSAPEEEPTLLPFEGGPPFDFTSMEAPGVWNYGIASQNIFDSGLNEPWMMPSFNTERAIFDWTSNHYTNETFGFDATASSQSALAALDGQMMLPFFDPTLVMDQPLGLWDAEAASQSALAVSQAPIAAGGAPSYLQDASFDLNQAYWTNHGAGMTDTLDPFADNVR
jgi:hypothetical protein